MRECTCSMSTYSLRNFSLSLILSYPPPPKKNNQTKNPHLLTWRFIYYSAQATQITTLEQMSSCRQSCPEHAGPPRSFPLPVAIIRTLK